MTDSRSSVFAKIAAATSATSAEMRPLPAYSADVLHAQPRLGAGSPWEIFSRNLRAVNGKPMERLDSLVAFLQNHGFDRGYCDPALIDPIGQFLIDAGFAVETDFDRHRYDDYAFGITRATGAIAESGTLIIDDFRTSDRLAALAPWVHVAVLDENEIVRTIPEAFERFGDCPNIIWVTGPSKTADVEGILIEGVHGPGEQIALLL